MNTKIKTVGLISLGCAKNRVDSEQLLGVLREAGYKIVADPAQADAIFINTCGFIESAKQESIETILEMAEYKAAGTCKVLAVTGCLSHRYPDALYDDMPEIDLLMGVSQYPRAAELLEKAARGERPRLTERGEPFACLPRVLTTAPYSAYVRISEGCDNRCTYCAIPMIRGGYISRPMEDIVAECEELAARGVTEITLIAQDPSRSGEDIAGRRLLPELLRRVNDIESVKWVRVLYCYPDSSDDDILTAIETLPKVAQYLDLPLQHGNARLLKAMNRRGTPDYIKSRIAECRRRGIAVRTTFIVGFPGETEEEFEELLAFVQEAKFDRMGAFAYSPEDDTPAAEMEDQIDEEVKAERLDRIMTLQQGISLANNQARVGSEITVLIERRAGKAYAGRSSLEAPEGTDGCVYVKASRPLAEGEYVRCRVVRAGEYDLYAEEML